MTSIKIITSDKHTLAARHFIPSTSVDHVVIINPATGVKQYFYSHFAEFLACQGFHVYTYDYRGIGDSRSKSIKELDASLIHWGELDQTAIIRYVKKRHPASSITVLGHSIGGQFIGLSPLASEIDNFVLIAAQTPYWKHYHGMMRIKVWSLWHLMIPALTTVCGYFPSRKIGLFENLPASAARQWASWGKTRHYLFHDFPERRKTYSSLTQPALAYSFSDDTFAPPDAVNDLLGFYKGLKIEHRHITPGELSRKSIGHFSFFRKEMKQIFWYEVADWILKKKKKEVSRKQCA